MKLSFFYSFRFIIFVLLLILHKFVDALSQEYEECKKPFLCENSNVNLTYPFYDGQSRPSYCGYSGFQIDCGDSFPDISMSSETYYLLGMNSTSDTVTVVSKDYYTFDGVCPQNMNIDTTLYEYASTDDYVSIFYGCPSGTDIGTPLPCRNASINNNNNNEMGYYTTQSSVAETLNATCHTSVVLPILPQTQSNNQNTGSGALQAIFQFGFGLEWIAENDLCDGCRHSGGECGSSTSLTRFACHCPTGSYDSVCSGSIPHKQHSINIGMILAILACLGIGLGIPTLVAGYMIKRRYSTFVAGYMIKRRNSTKNIEIDAFLKKYGSLPAKRYTYRSLKKITNSFKDKLGEGGFGIVYKGTLTNAQLVAVKLLKESNGSAEEFINEVTSIGKTNHVNVVTLLGFCVEGRRRALLYEFMPNGSLEKFIYAKNSHPSLNLDELFKIAVGIARGLEYLHQGCNTRIVHFDIKPHNILLDENLCPKISDFGLAKPFQKNESRISMSNARGTVGFIAPEVFLKGYGTISHKSDVYSYGMMVLDMVGCRTNENAEAEHSSEQYFPQWIYKQMEKTDECDPQDSLEEDERATQRKMILVSLWCIQTNPSRRPPISRVVEMLEGPLESLQLPNAPSFSPLISQPISSSNATISI